MILVDTSIWIEHLRRGNDLLAERLRQDRVLSHPFVIGELALGGAKGEVIELFGSLPRAVVASDDEVLGLIERERFGGRGIGYVDANLLASARLTRGARVWTFDKKLQSVAEDLNLRAPLET